MQGLICELEVALDPSPKAPPSLPAARGPRLHDPPGEDARREMAVEASADRAPNAPQSPPEVTVTSREGAPPPPSVCVWPGNPAKTAG